MRHRPVIALLPVLAALCLLAAAPGEAAAAACQGVNQCIRQVFPALFPFFVLTRLLLTYLDARRLPRPVAGLFERLFAVPASALPVFLLGLVSGYPVGAAAAAELYRQGGCSREEAERLLTFSNNCGPGFLLGVAAAQLPGGAGAARLLLGMQVLVSVWLGALLGAGRSCSRVTASAAEGSSVPFPRAFTGAVLAGGRSALIVCAYVVFFAAITHFLPAKPLLRGLVELTGGILLLSPERSESLCAGAFLLGFGGLSVCCQVLAALEDTGLTGRLYLPGRALHGGVLALGALLYAYAPIGLLPLGIGMVLSIFCVRNSRKRRNNPLYCGKEVKDHAVPQKDRACLRLLRPRLPRRG